MNRAAINSAGRLGSSYDGYRDRVIEQWKMDVQGQGLSPHGSSRCKIIRGNKNKNFNILQIIGVEDELRLSLLLKLIKKTGIAEVLNHSHCIDENTRFLYYSWICRTEEFHKRELRTRKTTGTYNLPINATHVITSVNFGIDLIVVLQLPSEVEDFHKIDLILNQICSVLLEGKDTTFKLKSDQNDLIKKILNPTAFSNVPSLTGSVEIFDIPHEISLIKRNTYRCQPVIYMLQPITSLYPADKGLSVKFNLLPIELRNSAEQYILEVRNRMKYVEASLKESVPKLLCGHLEYRLKTVHRQCSDLKEKLKNEIKRFSTLVVAARRGQKKTVEEINQALRDAQSTLLKNGSDQLVRYVDDLKEKGQFITHLRQKRIEYWNVAESNLDTCTDLKTIELMLINSDRRNRALCSSYDLNKENESKLIELHRTLIEEYEKNPTLRLIYIDFSYSSFSLQKMIILPSYDINHDKTRPKQQTPLPIDVPQPPLPSSSSSSVTNEIVNILLLGETGVGKSTFINALANYLTFNSLTEAQSNEPVVVIPVSFIMTIGDNFEERTIKFGEFDSLNNENFNSIGQSVTQHCKSYVFDLHQFDGKKLRIIDTPGFGDTRGLDQDDRNMEHILQYINNLTHLNAICFLLKPNSSRLNMFFRTCLTQLFSFLNPDARKNVIFCFTNGRSTFYTPGDTAPLIKTMLASASISNIPFKKENSFCFDSESFRYLVALQNGVPFTEKDEVEYEMSWSTSVKESDHLIDYINKKLVVYHMENGWQSIKHAQFEIFHMVRPILEAMRNILRNLILCEQNLSNQFIELSPKAVHCTATRCRICKSESEQVGKFWVIPTVLHEIQDNCPLCSCALDQHVPIYYMLEYQCLQGTGSRHQHATTDVLEILCVANAEFARFLMHTAHSTKRDPFLSGLQEMIHEEDQICKSRKDSEFNLHLAKDLTKLQDLYELYKQKLSERKSNQESINLSAIYSSIDRISKYSMVHGQIKAVKQSQQIMMKDYEYEVERI